MSSAETGRSDALRVVAEALDLPVEARTEWLAARFADPAQLAAAAELLRACEQAADSPVLDTPAAEFAAPILAEVEGQEPAIPESLQAALAGRYTIERVLGRGGQATVYLARDERHGRRVALKVLHPSMTPDDGPSRGASRFEREIELAARLSHPHILPLYDSGVAAGRLFYITPYVDGESLRERLARDGRLPLQDALHALRDVARALAHAHRQGVVHRDIKPANILLSREGDALVADFGVAKALAAAATPTDTAEAELTDAALVIGTPAYMAPEQAAGGPSVDHRADLYSFGVVAYQLLTGAPPFAGRGRHELLTAHLSEHPPSVTADHPELPAALGTLVDRLLAKRPADRPSDAAEVLEVLDGVMSGKDAAPSRRPLRRRGAALAGGVVLGLAVITAALVRMAPARDTGVVAPTIASIAVLPFASSGADLDDRAFSDGLTSELIGALGRVPGLRVAPRTTAAALRRQNFAVRTIGDTLGVEAVLEGGVRRTGERLAVTASLVRARDSSILWSQTYDMPASDPFAVQDRIARDVGSALSPQSAVASLPDRLVQRGTASQEAYEQYQKGRYLFGMRQRDAMLSAVQYFERAIELDSTYARAYAGMAETYVLMAALGHMEAREAYPRGRAAAERAIALDSLAGDAHAALAHQLFIYDWNWAAAGPALERAIALEPRDPTPRMYYASYLHSIARPEDALAQLAIAQQLDPLNPTAVFGGRIYVDTHRPDEAIAALRELAELEPRRDLVHQLLAHAYLQKRMPREAIASMRRAAALSGLRDSAQLAYIYAATGERAEARRVLGRLLHSRLRLEPFGFHLGMAYAGLGDADETFRWLEAAYAAHGGFMNLLAVTTGFDSVRSDPRFADLLRRMGLAAATARTAS